MVRAAESVWDLPLEKEASQSNFSMVHAAASVWECPPPAARLVLKVLCGRSEGDEEDLLFSGAEDAMNQAENDDDDPIRTPDGGGRLPLHLAVCARPAAGHDGPARTTTWRSRPEPGLPSRGPPSQASLISGMSSLGGTSLLSHPGTSGRGRRSARVYNPYFSRADDRQDGVAAMSTMRPDDSGPAPGRDDVAFSSVGSVTSALGRAVRERTFLRHTAVRDVLELHPAAASAVDPVTGKLPVVLAVESGKSYECAVGPLLDAFPRPFSAYGALGDARHRTALVDALLTALGSHDGTVRSEAVRTAGELAGRGGWLGEPDGLDPLVSDWLDAASRCGAEDGGDGRPAAVVGPGAAARADGLRTLASVLAALAEVLSSSRPGSVSDDVARRCLGAGRTYLSSPDLHVREASARVLGSTLDAVGDRDDASNVVREVGLGMGPDGDGSAGGGWGLRDEGVVVRHGRLLACNSILSTRWGASLMADGAVGPAIVSSVRSCMRDRNGVVRAAACRAVGPVLGKSLPPNFAGLDSSRTSADECPRGGGPGSSGALQGASALRELRGDILRATRAGECADVQLALARGLTRATRIMPDLFLCRTGMPVMDAALMLAISGSSGRNPAVRRAFQVFLWSALRMGGGQGGGGGNAERDFGGGGSVASAASVEDEAFTPQLMRYIAMAEGENGASMVKFVTQTLAKLEDLEDG